MRSFNFKKFLSLMLVVMMTITMMPVHAFAIEHNETTSENGTLAGVDSKPFEETVLLKQIKADIAKLLEKYLGKTIMTKEEVEQAVSNMDLETQEEAFFAIDDLSVVIEEMTDAERLFLEKYEAAATFIYLGETLYELLMPGNFSLYASKTVTVLDGKVSITDDNGNGSVSGGTVTVKASGGLFSKKTNNITITNTSGSKASISFDYSADKASSFKIAGANAAASGSYSVILEVDASLSITLVSNSGFSNTTATLKLSNFSCVAVKDNSNITFEFDSALGSVTAGGNSVANGGVLSVSGTEGVTLVATANGGTFLGWIDETGKILSTSATYTFIPAQDMTVKAVFAKDGGTPWFGVGSAASKTQSTGLLGLSKLTYYQVGTVYLFDDLNAAAAYAASDASNKALVLMNNATLPEGEYTIPAGVTLLIPFDSANTMYTTEAQSVASVEHKNYQQPTAFRTLTMAEGANITVNGAISLSAKHHYASGSRLDGGSPAGAVSFINMAANSSITINNGGALYAYGFITGSGSVVANSGASVYENFQIMDFRGGTQSTDMENGVFPLSQYYLQNIEVPLTIWSGATEYAYTTVYMSSSDFGSAVAFIAKSGAMFNLTDGYVTKDYDENTDRLVITAEGNVTVSSINMTVGTSSINSKNYELPINGNMTVNVISGNIALNQDIAFLPGSEIIIEEGATCTLGSGCNIYVYDADNWGNYIGVGDSYGKLKPVTYAPGRKYTRTDADLVDAKVEVNGIVDASNGYIYTANGDANISGTGTIKIKHGEQKVTHQYDQKQAQYFEIPLTLPANDNWTINHNTAGKVEVLEEATCTETGLAQLYCSCGVENGTKEVSVIDHDYSSVVTDPTCTEKGYTTYTCTACGHAYTDSEVPAKGHTYSSVVTDPTCTEKGYTTHTCTVCGHAYTDSEVSAKGHSLPEGATCTEAGHCTICGVELGAALGHDYKSVVTEPTCTAEGYTTHTCIRCGDTKVDSKVTAKGHTEVTDAAKAPTCTETGLTEGKHCSVCNTVIVAQETVKENGHTEVTDAAKAPTCTETGLTEGKHCSVCNEVFVKQEVIPAKGHSLAEGATCTNAGHCPDCGTELGEALGHDVVIDEAKAPTCTETGLTEGSHCGRCGETLVAQETVKENGHTEVIDPAVKGDCYNHGLTEGKHCSVCGEVLVAQKEVVNHTSVIDVPKKAPTRTENGYEAYWACQECGATGKIVVIEKLGVASIDNYADFIYNLALLEEMANEYVKMYPAKDPAALVIKYIRTGVERYNSGSWGIMAGYEDADFAKYVTDTENALNAQIEDGNYLAVTGLKDIKKFTLPNGQMADIGHVFGAMDITYHNKFGQNHADVSGWAGDLVDLLEVASLEQVSGTLDEMIKSIADNCFLKTIDKTGYPSFSKEDYDGDLDAYYIMNVLKSVTYGIEEGNNVYSLTEIIMNYMTEELDDEYRAAYFMTNRLKTNGTRAQVRNAVYTEYLANGLLATLEGTRDLSGAKDLVTLRRAVCYAFADYICKLAGDYVEKTDNPYYNVFNSTSVQLAPGITQEIHYATSADGKQMVYYVATADITRGDVHVYANYAHNDPSLGWEMSRVLDQANAAQNKYGDPTSPNYIPNYNVIASVNADGFNMSTGEPGGLLIMDGKEYHGINSNGFFGITKDGQAIIGTTAQYNETYKNKLAEAVGGFGTMLIKDGEICVTRTDDYYTSRASRTAVGITKTGKVVFMVLDGRQEPFSCGGSMQEIAQIMFEAGCVQAINLDGGGSTTYVARQPGDAELSVVNRPSDGFQRSVSTSLMMVSTAPSSTEFDHAMIESDYKYATIGTPVKLTGKGISPAGNETKLPEGYTWAVSDERFASISSDGVFTGKRNGTVEVYMMLDNEIIGMTEMNVVVPETVYFTRTHMDAVYGANTTLPIAASYNNKPVAISESDIVFVLENASVGTINGNIFVGDEASGAKVVKITACWKDDETVCGTITLNMFKQGENTFDFSMATGGDRQFAWLRDILNATTVDGITFAAIDLNEKMTASYIFAIDMTQIPIPKQLADLVYMLPGADAANASAWNFLLQLAERVSVLTEITATIDFDDNMIVDISELNIMNEYFSLTKTEFNEQTNTLTLTLNWIDQTKAIDPTTANPLCMLKGIKLTPKDGAIEGAGNRLNVVNSGTLSYKGYLRANALYSFAQKPENQAIYGLTPFVNPNLPSESGAWFGNTYATFEDTYTLAYIVKDGWTVEDGGFAYYQDGEKLTGVNKIDGLYYDFGENGINVGQTVFTGIFFDEDAKVYRYAELGVLSSGWKQIGEDWYYFRSTTMAAATGKYVYTSEVTYHFEENGKLISGVWVTLANGMRYYYGPTYYKGSSTWGTQIWQIIDGNRYCFDKDGFMLTGIQHVIESNVNVSLLYNFGENGKNAVLYTGPYDNYFYQDGLKALAYQLIEYQGSYYYVSDGNKVVKNKTAYLNATRVSGVTYPDGGQIPAGTYVFDAEGRLIIPARKNGVIGDYFYINDVQQKAYQLIEYQGSYYYISDGNKVVKNKTAYLNANRLSIVITSDGRKLSAGTYMFDAEGKLIFN